MSATHGYLVVANANAGSAEEEAVTAACEVLPGHPDLVELASTNDAEELDAALDRLEGRRLMVVGGDGSLHLVVSRLRDRGVLADTPLGLVPLGTGNDFARAVDLPLDPAAAARQVASGRPRRLDLLVDDEGGVVVNVAHAGLGAVAAERASSMKERLGPLAYPLGALLAAVRESGWDLRVEVDGRPLVGDGDRLLMVGVGNGTTIGGGTPLCPSARPDDGLLDVVAVTATGAAARVAFGSALRDGTHVERDDVFTARGSAVTISGEPVGHNADGEVSAEVTSRTYRVLPGAWSLVC